MKPVTPADIRSLSDYALGRDEMRKRVIALKKPRRIHVGDHLTLLFENRDTVLYQIQEMLRVELITDLSAIRHEISTYNELLPAAGELSATLLIEYATEDERAVHLPALRGLEDCVRIEVEAAPATPAVFDDRQISEDRISSVHYIRIPLSAEAEGGLIGGAPTKIVVEHPHLSVSVTLDGEQQAALAEDLRQARAAQG